MAEEDKESILLNTDFTLISDDFWGGHIYRKFELQYNSPFIGTIINPKDYLKMLKNINYYLLENDLVFLRIAELNFPVAVLGDILIYFNDYKSAEEADEKWKRRLRRINWDNLFVKMTIVDIEDAVEFGRLNYKNKIAFTEDFAKKRYNSWEQQVNCLEEDLVDSCKAFDVINWLNTG